MKPLDPRDRSAAIAAAIFLTVFGAGFLLLPKVMLYLGTISPYLAAAVGTVFVLAFFFVFWLRARYQRRR
ncbi:hypothetical protein ASG25_14815 [Rhizobium sp. Leaf384]|uniref:hypothetical protein n=1 Tax=unclassified Rhizobium TaxID=2613769 RepID=UPI0007143414|nr:MULTISPECIES: hypothetical protein [unclassified Rhizobium]KQS76565.1 hypothetical protein ASG58_12245 [Rhizobium sp. Leaf383]KQS77834.1 hypothetical protein ASG25_14815 [Rhizobium sp. Leaf384]